MPKKKQIVKREVPNNIVKSQNKVAKQAKPKKVKSRQRTMYQKRKKKFSTKSLVSLIVLFVMGISSGVFAGNWFVANFIGGPQTDYSLFSEEELRAGNDSIATQYASRTPSKNDAWKSFIAAEQNFKGAESYDLISNGLVSTIVTQTVYSRKTFDGENCYVEQISDGMVAVADRYIYKPAEYDENNEDTHITHVKGKLLGRASLGSTLDCPFDCSNGNKVGFIYNTDYSGNAEKWDRQKCVDAMGALPESPIAYIVSQKTILDCSDFKVVNQNGINKYCFRLTLHPGASVLNYVKQMKTVSSLSDYPSFTSVTLDVSLIMLDGKVMFDCIDVFEKYSVKYGSLSPKCTGTLHQNFYYNGDYTIPA